MRGLYRWYICIIDREYGNQKKMMEEQSYG